MTKEIIWGNCNHRFLKNQKTPCFFNLHNLKLPILCPLHKTKIGEGQPFLPPAGNHSVIGTVLEVFIQCIVVRKQTTQIRLCKPEISIFKYFKLSDIM